MSFLQIIILTILSLQFIEINTKSLDNSLTLKNLPLTPPSFQPKQNFSLPINVKQSKTFGVKSIGQNRNAKFFYSPSFLTGLGIGSLASSAALTSSPPMLSPNPELLTRRHSRPMNVFVDTNQSLPRPQIPVPQHYLNPYDATYPYFVFSTSLFDQSLRSIFNVLESLKTQLASKETPSESSRITIKNLNDEINNRAEETSSVKIVSKDDRNQLGVVDRYILKDVIKESIEEINKDLEQRQEDTTRTKKNTTDTTITTPITTEQNNTETINTNNSVTATLSPTPTATPLPTVAPPIVSTSKPGYHGGNPQPIHDVNLIHGFPSSEYGYPHNEAHYSPSSNIFDHNNVNGYVHEHGFGQNHPHHHGFAHNHPDQEFGFAHGHEVFNQDYYHSEPYYGAHENHSPVDTFSLPSGENWPIYPPYARAFKFSSKSTPKANNFRPSKLI